MLTLERTVATFVPKRYEQMKKTGKGVTLFVLCWVFSFGFSITVNFFWHVTTPLHYNNQLPHSSSILSGNTEILLFFIYLGIVANGANGVLVCFLYKHNKKQRGQLDLSNLNVRYQYSENIVTTRLLLALTGANFVMCIVAAIVSSCYYVARRNELMSDNDLFFIEQSFNVMASIYGILYNIIFLAMHRPNRDQLVRDVRRLVCLKRQSSVGFIRPQVKSIEGNRLSFKDEGAVYFSYLSQQWNA
uniref:G_PROTEIN_RECEP_F1_2 domain-containing protein n=1 Tax=Steinernema glaseri TaxID=37863 RepID=A0A1I8AEK0_9BILA